MALITTLTTDNGIAQVRPDGADNTWSVYLYRSEEDMDKKDYFKLGRGFYSPVEALDWANKILRGK